MKITKYDEDEFALRLSREEAIKMLALFVACRSRELLKSDGVDDARVLFDEDARVELFRALELDGDEDDLGDYPMLRSPTDRRIYLELYLRKECAEKFLPAEEPA